jgi:hypothetical protein
LEKGNKLESTAQLAKQLNPAAPEKVVKPGQIAKEEPVKKAPVQQQESSDKRAEQKPVLSAEDDVKNISQTRKKL